jgi:hypothetical protein
MRLPLVGQTYALRSLAAAAQETMNLYPERIEADGEKNSYALMGTPGYHAFADLTTISGAATPIRGLWSGGGRLFVAAGTKYMEIDSTGALVGTVHTIPDDAAHSPVTFLSNRNQLFLGVSGLGYYDNGAGPVQITLTPLAGTVLTAGTQVFWLSGDTFDIGMIGQTITIGGTGYTVQSITNPELLTLTASAGSHPSLAYAATPVLTVGTACWLSGYAVISRPGSRQFNISGINDFTSWNALDFDMKAGNSDDLAAVFSDGEVLYLFGTEQTEAWRNTGDANFPITKIPGASLKLGIPAPWCPALVGGKVYTLVSSAAGAVMAYRIDGFTPVRVSTHAEEQAWTAQGVLPAEAISYSYLDAGHWHWVINFAGNGPSWVYDATENLWHQRAHWDGMNFGIYRPWTHTYIPEWGTGKHIIGDCLTGKLYEMNLDFYDEDGSDMKRRRAMPYMYAGGKKIFIGRMEFELETGVGGTDTPQLDWSDDRGKTFGTPRVMQTSGGTDGKARIYATRLGSTRGRVPRLSITGQHKVCIVDASVEMTAGTS